MTSRLSHETTVSVIVPVYNCKKYLLQALESILVQGFEDLQLICVDDGSTDGSRQILGRIAHQDSRVECFHQSHAGTSAALNCAAAVAKGEYLARMDGDDVSRPGRLHSQWHFLNEHPEIGCLGGGAHLIDEKGRHLWPRKALPTNHHDIDSQNLRGNNSIVHPTVMMRKEVFWKVGGYDRSLKAAQDLDLWLRIAEVTRLANLEDVVLDYRIRLGSVGTSQGTMQQACAKQACQRAQQRRGIEVPYVGRPRPLSRRSERLRHYIRCVRVAQARRDRSMALEYSLRSIALAPSRAKPWRLFASSVRQFIIEDNG